MEPRARADPRAVRRGVGVLAHAARLSGRPRAAVAVAAGADVEVLAYLGEGEAVGISAAKRVSVPDVSPPYSREGAAPDYQVVPPVGASQWWIEVKQGARRGWFERGQYDLDGSDRCE